MTTRTDLVSQAFGRVLREHRLKKGISQTLLSTRADLDRTFISMIERGARQGSLATVFKLARALRLRPSTLVARTDRLLERSAAPTSATMTIRRSSGSQDEEKGMNA